MHKSLIKPIVGWDVGGAHLKAALLNSDGTLQKITQVPCALWRGLDELKQAIDSISNDFLFTAQSDITHAITMTGELVDLFDNRQQGVEAISQVMETHLMGRKLFYTGAKAPDFSGFTSVNEVADCWKYIASANWLASAAEIAIRMQSLPEKYQQGLLIDIGSTTADFIVLKDFKPVCDGLTDAARMQTEELVYTGVVRTPLMAITQRVNFLGTPTSVAAEYFATTADVYRLTGDLDDGNDMVDTADGQAKTILASAQRIARMIGRDVGQTDGFKISENETREANETSEPNLESWIALAHAFKSKQLERLAEALQKHLANFSPENPLVILGAGAGCFLAKQLAEKFELPFRDAASLIFEDSGSYINLHSKTNVCLPAAAVALRAYSALQQHLPLNTTS